MTIGIESFSKLMQVSCWFECVQHRLVVDGNENNASAGRSVLKFTEPFYCSGGLN